MDLRAAREKRRMTQEELEAASGVTQSLISAIEAGKRPHISWNTVGKLCRALRMRPEDIFPIDDPQAVGR